MKIVFFTGAGISRESGLQTFRDSDGLWEGYRFEDVASPEAWERNPAMVLEFYNMRRRSVRAAEPNAAHRMIAEFQREVQGGGHEVGVVTQNVDDLHERAGTTGVIHLHGEIMKSRSVYDDGAFFDCLGDLRVGDRAADGGQLRPHIVFFGEIPYNFSEARRACWKADVLVVVGSSLVVYPAASLALESDAPHLFCVDPRIPQVVRPIVRIEKSATAGVPEAIAAIRAMMG